MGSREARRSWHLLASCIDTENQTPCDALTGDMQTERRMSSDEQRDLSDKTVSGRGIQTDADRPVDGSSVRRMRRLTMPSRMLQRELCHKRGCILTCYVNGRKRFRAAPLAPSPDEAKPHGLAAAADASAARRGSDSH